MSERIDPGHAERRQKLSTVSVVMLLVGLAFLLYGFYEFSRGFFRPTSEFFADPNRVMDEDRSSGFTGIICIFLGAVGAMFGARGLFFARAGSILRYAAAETAPVAKDTVNYLADETTEGVEKVAAAITRGAKKGSGAPSEVVKVRCRACGYLESEDAKFCSGCGKPI